MEADMGDTILQGAIVLNDEHRALRRSKAMLVAFHRACDADEPEAALRFLGALDQMMQTFPNNIDRQDLMSALIVAHERFWSLTHTALSPSAGRDMIH
jgi:hypothetical protein